MSWLLAGHQITKDALEQSELKWGLFHICYGNQYTPEQTFLLMRVLLTVALLSVEEHGHYQVNELCGNASLSGVKGALVWLCDRAHKATPHSWAKMHWFPWKFSHYTLYNNIIHHYPALHLQILTKKWLQSLHSHRWGSPPRWIYFGGYFMYKLHCEIGIDEYILNLLKLWETNSWLLRYGLNKFQPRKMHILINFTCVQTFVQTAINNRQTAKKQNIQNARKPAKLFCRKVTILNRNVFCMSPII